MLDNFIDPRDRVLANIGKLTTLAWERAERDRHARAFGQVLNGFTAWELQGVGIYNASGVTRVGRIPQRRDVPVVPVGEQSTPQMVTMPAPRVNYADLNVRRYPALERARERIAAEVSIANIGRAMAAPIRAARDYNGMARQMVAVDELSPEAPEIYDHDTRVILNGVAQRPGQDFTYREDGIVEFANAPAVGDTIRMEDVFGE